jgi:hypothetical protein
MFWKFKLEVNDFPMLGRHSEWITASCNKVGTLASCWRTRASARRKPTTVVVSFTKARGTKIGNYLRWMYILQIRLRTELQSNYTNTSLETVITKTNRIHWHVTETRTESSWNDYWSRPVIEYFLQFEDGTSVDSNTSYGVRYMCVHCCVCDRGLGSFFSGTKGYTRYVDLFNIQ